MVHWILHCRSFNTVFRTLTDPITGQRSQDGPILPQYTTGPPPTHFSPSSQHSPHSFILLSSHPSAQLSSLTSSPLNGYWLCSQGCRSLSVPITNVSANHRLTALSDPISYKTKTALLLSLKKKNLKSLFKNVLTSGIPHCSQCCCCSSSANLFSLWLPFSQLLPSLRAFSPTLLHCYSLRLAPTLSFILSLFSLPITW